MENVRVFYLRDGKGFPVACVASMLLAVGENQPKLVRYAMSVYNHSDRVKKPNEFPFLQARGREIALGRLERARNKCRLIEIESSDSVKQRIVEEIRDTTIRLQVIEACELWLHEMSVRAYARNGYTHSGATSQADGHA